MAIPQPTGRARSTLWIGGECVQSAARAAKRTRHAYPASKSMEASAADVKGPVLTTGVRGPGGFPTPVTEPRRRYRLWRWSDVTHWLTTQLREADSPNDQFVTVINACLELRRRRDELAPASRNRLNVLAGLS